MTENFRKSAQLLEKKWLPAFLADHAFDAAAMARSCQNNKKPFPKFGGRHKSQRGQRKILYFMLTNLRCARYNKYVSLALN